MLKDGVERPRAASLEEARVVYVRPCISEAGRVTASTRLTLNPALQPAPYGLFDVETFCLTLELARHIGDTRCSPSLGTARITRADLTLLVSKEGVLNLRGARDKDEAVGAIRTLSRTLWGSAVCPACGNVGFDCISGGCTECFRSLCPLLKNGPPDMLEGHLSLEGETTVREALVRQRVAPHRGRLGESLARLEEATRLIAHVAEGKPEGDSFNTIRIEINDAMRQAVEHIAETEDYRDAILGFAFVGLGLDLSRITHALQELSALKPASEAAEIATDAIDAALKGYERFKTHERPDPKLADRYDALKTSWSEAHARTPDDRTLVWTLKALKNAFYISRLPELRLPN
jgi:hypothetical protein